MKCKTKKFIDDGGNFEYVPKKPFTTLDEAISNAKKVNLRDTTTYKVVAYKCPECLEYHIGRNGRKIKEKEREKWRQERIL